MLPALISAEELNQLRQRADTQLIIVDCRFQLQDTAAGERDWQQSHIPGARYAHLDRDLSAPIIKGKTGRHPLPSPAHFAAVCARLGIHEHSHVIAYDDGNCAYAARLWWMLRWVGHARVQVLDGGWRAWRQQDLPVDASQLPDADGVFVAVPDPDQLVDADAVQAALARGELVIDARSADRFAGQNETLDPVAGHIPGARNFPFVDNLDAGSRYLPSDALRARILRLLPEAAHKPCISYCGSGVTACQNILAFVHAGFPAPRLYAGSWSEWITDPARPISTDPAN